MNQHSRNEKLVSSLGWLLVAVVIGLSLWRLNQYTYGGDAAKMLEPIHRWVATGEYSSRFVPGTGILAYLLYLVVHNIPLSGVLLTFLCYLGVALLSYIFVVLNEPGKKHLAPLVVFVVVLNPLLFTRANTPFSEVVYALCLLLIVAGFVRLYLNNAEPARYTMLGLAIGLSYFIREEAVVVYGCSVLLMLQLFLTGGRKGLIASVMFTTLPVALCVFCYAGLVYLAKGEFALSLKTEDVFLSWSGKTDRLLVGALSFLEINEAASPVEYIAKNPLLFLFRLGYNSLQLIQGLIVNNIYVVLPFIVLLAYQGRNLSRRITQVEKVKSLTGLMLGVAPSLYLVLFYLTERFFIPYSAVLSLLVGYAMIKCVDVRRKWHGSLLLVSIVGLAVAHPFDLVAGTQVWPSVTTAYLGDKDHALPYRRAGEWLRDNTGIDRPIIITQRKGRTVLAFIDPARIENENGTVDDHDINSIADVYQIIDAHGPFDYLILNVFYTEGDFQRLTTDLFASDQLGVCHSAPTEGYIIASTTRC